MRFEGVISGAAVKARAHQARIQWRLLMRNLLNKVAIAYIGLLVFIAVFAPMIAPHPESITGKVDLAHKLLAPSWSYPMGTDEFGRDLFSRVLYGARISLGAAALTVALALAIGVPLGALAGAVGGRVDDVIMRLVDVFLSFPPVLLAMAVAAFLGPSLRNAMIAIAASWWPWYTRLVRGQAVSMRERQFVRSARVIGTTKRTIVFKHVLPNCMGPTIVQASLDFGAVILMLAALSFLGLGAQIPTPEWGLLVNMSRSYFLVAWWLMIFPGLAITLTVLAFSILGDGIREVLDPKSRTA